MTNDFTELFSRLGNNLDKQFNSTENQLKILEGQNAELNFKFIKIKNKLKELNAILYKIEEELQFL